VKKALFLVVFLAVPLAACSTGQIYDSGPAKQATSSLSYGAIPVTNGAGDRIPVMSGQAPR
jgi:hypothetical protein